jgi:hypothetical protein
MFTAIRFMRHAGPWTRAVGTLSSPLKGAKGKDWKVFGDMLLASLYF